MFEILFQNNLLHLISQFDWESIKTGLFVVFPLLLATAGALIGEGAPLLGVIFNATTGSLRSAGVSAIGLMLGVEEIGMAASGIGIYSGLGETMSRAFEEALRQQQESLSPDERVYLPRKWEPIYDYYFEPKRPIDISWLPEIDCLDPFWRGKTIEEIAKILGVQPYQIILFCE